MRGTNTFITVGKVFKLDNFKKDEADPKKSYAFGNISSNNGKDKDRNYKNCNMNFKAFGYNASFLIDAINNGAQPTCLMSGGIVTESYESSTYLHKDTGAPMKVYKNVLEVEGLQILDNRLGGTSNQNQGAVNTVPQQQPTQGMGQPAGIGQPSMGMGMGGMGTPPGFGNSGMGGL